MADDKKYCAHIGKGTYEVGDYIYCSGCNELIAERKK